MAAVLFDLFETLVTEAGTNPTRASSLGPMLGLDESEFRAEWKLYRPRVLLGQCTFEQALIAITQSLGSRMDDRAIKAIVALRATEKAALFGEIDEQVMSMIRVLSERGYRLGLISNCFAEDVEAWPECAISGRFSCTLFSHHVGAVKPHPEIYRYALRQLEVEPDGAVFIGDGSDGELEGAEQVGVSGYCAGWFTRRESVVAATGKELRNCNDVLDLLSSGWF